MNKAELISAIAEKSGENKAAVDRVLSALQSTVIEEVASGGKITLVGFLTLESQDRAARTARNPATQELMDVPATRVVRVRPGSAFRDAVKAGKKGK